MHIILLHGAVGSSKQFDTLAPVLKNNFSLHLIDFYGHGGSSFPHQFSIRLFSEQVTDYIETNLQNEKVSLFGYSMGGYVAMYIARHWPASVSKIVTLATKFQWNEDVAAAEVRKLQPDIMEHKVPAYAAKLAAIHEPENWKVIMSKTANMLKEMGANNPLQSHDYGAIQNECLLLLGDQDKMVTLAETEAVYRQLKQAQLGVLPATPHPFEQVNVDLLGFMIKRFLQP